MIYEKRKPNYVLNLEESEKLTKDTSVVAEEKLVTCPCEGGTINEGDTRCKNGLEYKCGSNG